VISENASKLSRWHRRGVIACAIALALTGVVWMAGYYALGFVPDVDGPSPRSALHLIIMAHGVAGYVGAIFFGTLLGRHIPAGLRQSRKLVSGLSSLTLVIVLVVTALLLYYAGEPGVRDTSSLSHQIVGVVAAVVVAAHLLVRVSKD